MAARSKLRTRTRVRGPTSRRRVPLLTASSGNPRTLPGIVRVTSSSATSTSTSQRALLDCDGHPRESGAHQHGNFRCSEEPELIFLSHPDSLHCRNLLTNPSMAVSIFSPSQKWNGSDQGVQLFGTCSQASGRNELEAERLYGERFPAYAEWRRNLKDDNIALGLSVLPVCRPQLENLR